MTRTAISPRLAIRMRRNTRRSGLRPDQEQRLSELHGLAVLRQDLDDLARELGADLVHHLHRFDDAEHRLGLHARALVDEGLLVGRRRAIERADDRALE